MVKEKLPLYCRFKLYEDDVLKIDQKNLITNDGLEIYANILSGDVSELPNFLALDAGIGTYTKSTTVLFNEILRKAAANIVSPANISAREFVINENEAISQIYGFGLVTDSIGGVFTNLLNQSFNHEIGKTLKIIWSIEVND